MWGRDCVGNLYVATSAAAAVTLSAFHSSAWKVPPLIYTWRGLAIASKQNGKSIIWTSSVFFLLHKSECLPLFFHRGTERSRISCTEKQRWINTGIGVSSTPHPHSLPCTSSASPLSTPTLSRCVKSAEKQHIPVSLLRMSDECLPDPTLHNKPPRGWPRQILPPLSSSCVLRTRDSLRISPSTSGTSAGFLLALCRAEASRGGLTSNSVTQLHNSVPGKFLCDGSWVQNVALHTPHTDRKREKKRLYKACLLCKFMWHSLTHMKKVLPLPWNTFHIIEIHRNLTSCPHFFCKQEVPHVAMCWRQQCTVNYEQLWLYD